MVYIDTMWKLPPLGGSGRGEGVSGMRYIFIGKE